MNAENVPAPAEGSSTPSPGAPSVAPSAPSPDAEPAPAASDRPVGAAGLPYHRLALAQPRPRWWRPLVTVLVAAVTYAVLMGVGGVLMGVAVLVDPGLAPALTGGAEGAPDVTTPVGAFASFAMVALMLPALMVGLWAGERRSIGTMSSVAGRLRRDQLGRRFGQAFLVLGITHLLVPALGMITGATPLPRVTPATFGLLAVALLIVPIQSAAEEYVFRGVPQQVLGSWLKSPWWGILLPIPVFVFGHIYNLPGLIGVGLIALIAGLITWRTGGLEAAIALHAVNNGLLMLHIAFGIGNPAAQVQPLFNTIVQTAGVAVFGALVLFGRDRAPKPDAMSAG